MIDLVRPRAFVPVHGTLHHLSRHAALAREAGVPEVAILENGDVGELDDQGLRKSGRVAAGRVHVFGGRALPPRVLEERSSLASRGVVHVTVPLDGTGRVGGPLSFTSRGVLDETLDEPLVTTARREALIAIEELSERTDSDIAFAVQQAVRRSLGRVLGFKPVTLATVVRFDP
jgi:ribonuclease J